MANTVSAKKAARKNIKQRARNLARRTALKSAIKRVRLAVQTGVEKSQVEEMLRDVAAKLARAKNKKVLHPNAAARKLSRLAKLAATSANA